MMQMHDPESLSQRWNRKPSRESKSREPAEDFASFESANPYPDGLVENPRWLKLTSVMALTGHWRLSINVRFWPIADMPLTPPNVRFSNRPFEVKRFQTIHHSSVDVACGLVLLFGLGAKALPVWDSKTRWNNLSVGLAVRPTAGSSGHTNSPHPSSRERPHSSVQVSSRVLL